MSEGHHFQKQKSKQKQIPTSRSRKLKKAETESRSIKFQKQRQKHKQNVSKAEAESRSIKLQKQEQKQKQNVQKAETEIINRISASASDCGNPLLLFGNTAPEKSLSALLPDLIGCSYTLSLLKMAAVEDSVMKLKRRSKICAQGVS
uniref:Uncharacterized protein n=1 Tax=Ditylenchus dipsaci TaxID=166011 RepID=A0A915ERQ6_9BILA